MITANEARELYNQSGAEADAYIKSVIEERVIAAARSGKCSVDILIDSKPGYQSLESALQFNKKAHVYQQVLTKLRDLGYNVQIAVYGDSYVPRGLANDAGEGPTHTNYGFIIGW